MNSKDYNQETGYETTHAQLNTETPYTTRASSMTVVKSLLKMLFVIVGYVWLTYYLAGVFLAGDHQDWKEQGVHLLVIATSCLALVIGTRLHLISYLLSGGIIIPSLRRLLRFGYHALVGSVTVIIIFTLGFWACQYPSLQLYALYAALFLFIMQSFAIVAETLALGKEPGSNLTEEHASVTVVIMPGMLIAGFTIVCYALWQISGSRYFTLPSSDTGWTAWCIFTVDQIVRAVFLDFAEVYRIDVSPIEHTRDFWICTFIFAFRTILATSLISWIVRNLIRIKW